MRKIVFLLPLLLLLTSCYKDYSVEKASIYVKKSSSEEQPVIILGESHYVILPDSLLSIILDGVEEEDVEQLLGIHGKNIVPSRYEDTIRRERKEIILIAKPPFVGEKITPTITVIIKKNGMFSDHIVTHEQESSVKVTFWHWLAFIFAAISTVLYLIFHLRYYLSENMRERYKKQEEYANAHPKAFKLFMVFSVPLFIASVVMCWGIYAPIPFEGFVNFIASLIGPVGLLILLYALSALLAIIIRMITLLFRKQSWAWIGNVFRWLISVGKALIRLFKEAYSNKKEN